MTRTFVRRKKHNVLTTKSLPFDKSAQRCNSRSPQGQTSESTMDLSDAAPHVGNAVSLRRLLVTSINPDTAIGFDSAFSLSASPMLILQEAFKGLPAADERSPFPNCGSRDATELLTESPRQSDHSPNGFIEEQYSFDAVFETGGVASHSTTPGNQSMQSTSKKISCIESSEFFNYLTAIGGS
jgi:hypothetical protein